MRRLLLLASLLAALVAPEAGAAPYAGQLKRANAHFELRGVDGATYKMDVELLVPWYAGDDPAQLAVTTTRCAGRRCDRPAAWVRTLTTKEYGDSVDLNTLTTLVKLGTLQFAVQWYAPPGFGDGPAPTGERGVTVRSGAAANAVLQLAGKNGHARCEDRAARTALETGVLLDGYVRPESWPDHEPAGFRMRRGATRLPVCVRR